VNYSLGTSTFIWYRYRFGWKILHRKFNFTWALDSYLLGLDLY